VTVTIKDAQSNAISGITPTFSMSGTLNTLIACSTTDVTGISTCGVTSTKAEAKSVQLLTPLAIAGNTLDFNPNGINIQVPIEMLDRGLSSTTGTAGTSTTFTRSRTSFNPADYVADTNLYMFEVVANNTNPTTSYTIYLVDNAGLQITDSAIIIPPSTTQKRFNILWTPNSSADNYRIKVPVTAVAGQVQVHSAKIIVEQTAAVATKIYIPLANFTYTSDNASDTSNNGQVTSTTSATYTTSNYFTKWNRNDALYDAIASGTPWTLETVTSNSVVTTSANAALFSNNVQITGAITTLTGGTANTNTLKSVSFASNATNFLDTKTVELRINNSAGATTRLYKAGLWLKLKFLKKTEIGFRVATRKATNTSAAIPDARFLWDAGAWSNPTVYFQATAIKATGTSTMTLQDHGTNDVGTTAPLIVAGSTITPAITFGIVRTGALTLTDMNRYFVQHNSSSTANILGSAFIFIQAHD
jgi:hypothetical protein